VGMYFKVCHDGREGNLWPVLLLEHDGICKNDDC